MNEPDSQRWVADMVAKVHSHPPGWHEHENGTWTKPVEGGFLVVSAVDGAWQWVASLVDPGPLPRHRVGMDTASTAAKAKKAADVYMAEVIAARPSADVDPDPIPWPAVDPA